MKNLIIASISNLIIAALFIQPSIAQDHNGHNHDEHLSILVTSYLQMNEALAKDDFGSAEDHLASFSEEVFSSQEMNHHPEHADKHEKHHGAMVAAVKQALEADTIEQLRDSFSDITDQLMKAVENLGYTDGPLYIQFCPMAGDDGVKWLSDKEEILNPYYGARMLKCGRVVEQIQSNDPDRDV